LAQAVLVRMGQAQTETMVLIRFYQLLLLLGVAEVAQITIPLEILVDQVVERRIVY
jgi:hypothetical protein